MDVRTEPCELYWAVNGTEHRCGQPAGHASDGVHFCFDHFACWPMVDGSVVLDEFGDIDDD